jgi:hypothetical protein
MECCVAGQVVQDCLTLEDDGNLILSIMGNHLPNNTASHSIIFEQTLLWEPQSFHQTLCMNIVGGLTHRNKYGNPLSW